MFFLSKKQTLYLGLVFPEFLHGCPLVVCASFQQLVHLPEQLEDGVTVAAVAAVAAGDHILEDGRKLLVQLLILQVEELVVPVGADRGEEIRGACTNRQTKKRVQLLNL